MTPPRMSVIVPAYNEEEGLAESLSDLVREVDQTQAEILVVDDGSTDRTHEIAREFPVRLLCHKRNKGYGAALKSGIRHARGEIVAFMDADAQHKAAFLHDVLGKMEKEGLDMVIGVRTGGMQSTVWRTPGKWLIRKLAEHLLRDEVPDINSGMRVLRRDQALRFLPLCPDGFSITTTLTLCFMCERMAIGYVPIEVAKRVGRSTVRWRDGIRTLFNVAALIVLFRPIRVFLPLSAALFAIGALFGLYGIAYVGRLPATSTVLVTSAITVFCFGFLAEQIALLRRVLVDFQMGESEAHEVENSMDLPEPGDGAPADGAS